MLVLQHSNILNAKHFPGFFMKNKKQNKTFEWNCILFFFYNSVDMTQLTLIRHGDDGSCMLLAGRFLSHAAICIALTVVPSCTIYFSSGWMWLEFHWPLEHGTCPLAAGGQTAQLLRWPRSTAVLYIFHPKVPNLTSIPPCAPHRAQLTALLDLPEV